MSNYVGLQWHYDVTGAEPIIRDYRVYNSGALQRGTAMASGAIATAENTGAAIVAAGAVLSNIVGVLQEDKTAAACLSVVATGVDFYAKMIINPFAVWLGQYSTSSSDQVTNTSASATGYVFTATQVAHHERSWVYITNTGSSTGGFGNLFQVGAATSTTSLTAATTYAGTLKANTTSDTAIVLIAPFSADVAGGSVNLSTQTGRNARQIQGYTTSASAGSAVVLENYIVSPTRALEPLVAAQHSGVNLAGENPSFFADIMFSEHLFACGGVVNTRVIT
jgi:hypothetical protein